MPGVIGASIFSPRPARGYRFHSLQVEIIAYPSRRHWPQKNELNYRSAAPIRSCSERLTEKMLKRPWPNNHIVPTPEGLPAWGPIHRKLWRIVTDCGGLVTTLTRGPSGDRDRKLPANTCLRGGTAGRKIAPLQSRQTGGAPCRAKLRSIRFCVKKAMPGRYLAWLRSPQAVKR